MTCPEIYLGDCRNKGTNDGFSLIVLLKNFWDKSHRDSRGIFIHELKLVASQKHVAIQKFVANQKFAVIRELAAS